DCRVKLPIVVLGPGVEAPGGRRDSREVSGRARIAPQKDWTRVARPTAIGRNVVKANAPGATARRYRLLWENVCAHQQLSNFGFGRFILNEDVDPFHARPV